MSDKTLQTFYLDNLSNLEMHHVDAKLVDYKGRSALRLLHRPDENDDGHAIAVLTGSYFRDGIIKTAIVGDLVPDAPADMRGFVGIAFRVQNSGSQFECFYIRPTNGRANEQIRRNHATQYISHPDYPWYRLREENAGVYESYADMVEGEWIDIKIEVSGVKAALYLNNAEQPCLLVNDLKLGDTEGAIALWIGYGTLAHFSQIEVTPF